MEKSGRSMEFSFQLLLRTLLKALSFSRASRTFFGLTKCCQTSPARVGSQLTTMFRFSAEMVLITFTFSCKGRGKWTIVPREARTISDGGRLPALTPSRTHLWNDLTCWISISSNVFKSAISCGTGSTQRSFRQARGGQTPAFSFETHRSQIKFSVVLSPCRWSKTSSKIVSVQLDLVCTPYFLSFLQNVAANTRENWNVLNRYRFEDVWSSFACVSINSCSGNDFLSTAAVTDPFPPRFFPPFPPRFRTRLARSIRLWRLFLDLAKKNRSLK